MKQFEIRFTDYVDGSPAARILEAGDEAARGLILFRDKYAKNPACVMAPEDEKFLLAAFCETHDAITDHIIERCGRDFDYCHALTKMACAELSKQGMDWNGLGEQKYAAFRASGEAGKLDEVRRDFNAFVQFLIRANRPVPSLFQDLVSLREL